MKTVKPQTLSILTRPFELADRFMLALTGIVCLDFATPKKLAHEAMLWMAVQEHMGEAAMDEAMAKPRGEVLVLGSACAKRGTTTTAGGVRFELRRGERVLLNKGLMVLGDRTWTRFGMTQPEPFEQMPVLWERAFGGPDYEPNPIGRGLTPIAEADGTKVHRLPNVEDPANLVQGPGDRPIPMGFGPLQITRKERMSRVGTYDKNWLDKRYPAPPDDFHWEFYNVAPLDQRISGFFDGSETIRVDGMHPDHRTLEMTLPSLIVKFIVLRKSNEAELGVESHQGRIDSLIALPTAGKLAVVFRTVIPVETDDAHDIAVVMGAVEAADAPKPLTHYREALAARTDPERALYALLNDHELLPDWNVDTKETIEQTFGETAKILKPDGHAFAYVERGIENTIATMRASLVDRGMDTTAFEERVAKIREDREKSKAPERFEDMGAFLQAVDSRAKEAIKEANEQLDELKARAKTELAKVGVTDDPLVKGGSRKTGPPECFADNHLDRLRQLRTLCVNAHADTTQLDAQLADPAFNKRLRDAEDKILAIYRQSAHIMPPIVGTPTEAEAKERGAMLLALAKENKPVSNIDLTHADLSGLDFSNLNLEGALLEKAKVSGARFKNARMKDVVLAHAQIRDTVFDGADLTSANLAFIQATDTTFTGANLENAVLREIDIKGGSFRKTVIGGIHTSKMQMQDVDFSETKALRALFIEARFENVKLDGSDLSDSIFTESQVHNCTFVGATLRRTVVFQTVGNKVGFERADLRDTRFVDCTFPNARFAAAKLGLTLMRGCKFIEAEMEDLVAENCDFSEADFSRANLMRTSAQKCLFIRTTLDGANARKMDLTNSCLQKASIRGTDFRGSNCFRADFGRAVGDDKTDFSGAYVKETRTLRDPKSKKPLFTA